MEKISTTVRELATIIESVEKIGQDNPDYRITHITPTRENLLALEDVTVNFQVEIPFLADEAIADEVEINPDCINLNDNGILQIGLVAAMTTPDEESSRESLPTHKQSGSDSNNGNTNRGTSDSKPKNEKIPDQSKGKTARKVRKTPDLPAYRDREKLASVYEQYDTFPEMTEALGVDVTPQTVRRYMIQFGIHEPASQSCSQPKERLLATDPESVNLSSNTTNTSESTDGECDSSTKETLEAETNGSKTDGAGDKTTPEADEATTHVPSETTDDTPTNFEAIDDTHPSDKSGVSIHPDGSASSVDLPNHLTLTEIKTTVKDAQTLYEAQQQLDLNRSRTQELLKELNLLDLVHGRATTRHLAPNTIEEINNRLQSSIPENKQPEQP